MRPSDIWNRRYTDSLHRQNESWLGQHTALLGNGDGRRALDLGCGNGEAAIHLSSLGFCVTACDFSCVAIDHLQAAAPEVRALCLDMLDGLPFEDGSFEVIAASLSTHYFSASATEALYSDIRRVMAPDGLLLLRVNSEKEMAADDREIPIEAIEPGFYRMKGGLTKRYFSQESLRALLAPFCILSMREVAFQYHGHEKHAIEAIVKRMGVTEGI